MTSSTSNFEFNELETTPRNGGVFAVSVVILLIFCIELTLWNTRQWFSDQAAWYWSEKQSLVDDGQMGAEVVFIGTSVTFHGIDTETLNEGLTPKNQFSNLSLNGLTLQYQTQVLNEYIASNGSPDEVVLELRECCVTPQSWKNGPAWRFLDEQYRAHGERLLFLEARRHIRLLRQSCARVLRLQEIT